jgi:general secretion pathway protein L
VVLRLPPGLLLERQVTLPLAAEQGLERVVRYEMDRFTPFAAEEVFYSAGVLQRDRAQGRLMLGIALVPKVRLAAALAALAEWRLTPGLLEADGVGREPRRIPLAGPDLRPHRWRRRGFAVALAGCAALAVVAAGLPFWLQMRASDDVAARIAALKPRVAQAEALRRRMANSAEGSDVIGAERARVGDALSAVATLTTLLPDNTHLTALVMQKRQVTLEGQSTAAAKLLSTLSADPAIRNAAFAAPVTRAENGADLFSIKAEITP